MLKTQSLSLHEVEASLTGSKCVDFWSLSITEQLERLQDPYHVKQNKFVLDRAQFIAAFCTRRAGKTNGLALRFCRAAIKHPRSFLPYFALTRDSAKNIMWPILQDINERFSLGMELLDGDLTATFKNGSYIKLMGADMKNFVPRIKGIKTPFAAIDEAQDFSDHIRQLVEDILTPATADYGPDGCICVSGTPGPIPFGYFYEVTGMLQHGFKIHEFSIYDNPYMPDPRGFVQQLKEKKGWDDANPSYNREYGGPDGKPKWVLDLDALVFRYNESKNSYKSLPVYNGDWSYVVGVDVGFDDADAIAVLGWNEYHRKIYLIEEHVRSKQGITDLAERVGELVKKYDPLKIVMDTGGLGKKIADEMRRRFSLPIAAAEKARKFEYIELLNDAMRTGTFFATKDSHFVADSVKVKWDLESVNPKISDSFHSDICDAVLYAYREALHWLSEPEDIPVVAGTPEWMKKQEREMEELAARHVVREDSAGGFEPWE